MSNSKMTTQKKTTNKSLPGGKTNTNVLGRIERVYQAGYFDGYEDGTFLPSAKVTRGQTAKILYNFLKSVQYID